ncbi:electron transfer flavoprotein subunit beta/FixA family protein [Cohnella thailandensis]|uniref:Electron transfer flavoprotein subunit beta n=1 Tax=Cohnella thailandensis TaxID=557557 RepID=A0A841T2N3_9BACL|nr:electron transfer flavoprotein subunit beta/FixA family protein [Cohnella thailandensis]MBB6637862.1 electron transfer flavoprotein subunit beta/FixA family protein [Cohnella thailandensis]MBP1977431.1 electron transfer flavoprotein beta subunit [Cohnella thailandensis]
MNIYVLLKQTFDTEEKIVLREGRVSEDGVKFVINPYDEYAVEEALLLKEAFGGTVTVVSVGPARAAEALRTALAMGADEAVLVDSEGREYDEAGVALLLEAYLREQPADLILAGNFSTDTGGGQVALRLAERLGIPHASSIINLEVSGGKATVVRDAEGDAETLELALPALFTAQQGLNEPRYPSLPGIMRAKKKPLKQLAAAELGLTEERLAPLSVRAKLALPAARQAGRRLSGTPSEQAAALAQLLRGEAKVL